MDFLDWGEKYFPGGKYIVDAGTAVGNAAKNFGNFVGSSWNNMIDAMDMTGSSAQQNEYEKNLALQTQAQDYNSKEAATDRAWQQMMSNTAYRRAFADLEAAGYNPYLALTAGSAASTPGGASGSSSASSVSRQNNKTLDYWEKIITSLIKTGSSSSASSLKSIASIIALALAA